MDSDEKREFSNGSEPDPPTKADPDPAIEEELEIRSNNEQKPLSSDEIERPEIRNGEGSRSLTMRELLNELKEEKSPGRNIGPEDGGGFSGSGAAASDAERRDAGSSYSQESSRQSIGHDDVAMNLINSVSGVDEEGRSRQRILAFAAKRYASAIERNPQDHDALYNWALVLQESADNVGPDSSSPSKDALLEEACKKYDEATQLCPTLHDAFYNWAIAISDRAKMRGRTKEAEELWKQATKNYEKAVQLNWNSPQALNNWGLALQELSAIVPAREKQTIVRSAISKFRASIQLQFDFHRAIYNLGTVLYGLAEDTLRTGRPVDAKEISPNELYSQSAIYIAAAHALKPNYSVYRSALRLVRSMGLSGYVEFIPLGNVRIGLGLVMVEVVSLTHWVFQLPLPYFKVGYLTAPPAGNPIAPHTDWRRSQFVLNQEGLQQVSKVESPDRSQVVPYTSKSVIKVDVPDIVSVSTCADLTLPPGAGLCVDTIHGPVYLVADAWESLDGWLDAIRLVYTIYARGKSDVLAVTAVEILPTPSVQETVTASLTCFVSCISEAMSIEFEMTISLLVLEAESGGVCFERQEQSKPPPKIDSPYVNDPTFCYSSLKLKCRHEADFNVLLLKALDTSSKPLTGDSRASIEEAVFLSVWDKHCNRVDALPHSHPKRSKRSTTVSKLVRIKAPNKKLNGQ
ncbi:hypothetical protein ACLOJK_006248 [Asimina triloba]